MLYDAIASELRQGFECTQRLGAKRRKSKNLSKALLYEITDCPSVAVLQFHYQNIMSNNIKKN